MLAGGFAAAPDKMCSREGCKKACMQHCQLSLGAVVQPRARGQHGGHCQLCVQANVSWTEEVCQTSCASLLVDRCIETSVVWLHR